MKFLIDLPKPFVCDMRVDLCCTDVAMPEHHLDGSKVGAVFEQMSRKGVSKRVRVGGNGRTPIEDPADIARTEPPIPAVQEERPTAVEPLSDHDLPTIGEPGLDGLDRW